MRSANFNTVIGTDEADVARRLERLEERLTPSLGAGGMRKYLHDYRSESAIAVGTVDQVIERLLDMKSRGMGYAIHYMPELAFDDSVLDLYEREVMPALR